MRQRVFLRSFSGARRLSVAVVVCWIVSIFALTFSPSEAHAAPPGTINSPGSLNLPGFNSSQSIRALQNNIQRLESINSLNEQQRKDLNRFKERLAALQKQNPHGIAQTDEEKEKEEKDEDDSKKKPPRDAKYFTNRKDLARAIDKFSIEVEGLADKNRDGIADWRQTYRLGEYDCASISAMTDDTLRRMAKAGYIDYQQGMGAMQVRGGSHAANWVPGIGHFDLVPARVGPNSYVATWGTPWYNFDRVGYELFRDGFPDAGEYTPPGYTGPMKNTAPFAFIPGTGSGGGGLGVASGAGFMNMLQQLSGRNGGGNLAGGNSGLGSRSPGSSLSQRTPTNTATRATSKQPSAVTKPEAKKTPAAPSKTSQGSVSPSAPDAGRNGSNSATSGSGQNPTAGSVVIPQGINRNTGAGAGGIPSTQKLGFAAGELLGASSSSSTVAKSDGGSGTIDATGKSTTGSLKSVDSSGMQESLDVVNRPAAWDIPASSPQFNSDALEVKKGFF